MKKLKELKCDQKQSDHIPTGKRVSRETSFGKTKKAAFCQ
jgi:hypothetical protein